MDGKRSDFHMEQQVYRRKDNADAEQDEDWFFNAPLVAEDEEPETV